MEKVHPHVHHLRKHKNVLYGAVVLLLVLQLVTFVSISSQSAKILSQQAEFQGNVDASIGQIKQENQFRIGEIVKALSEQRTDIENQIELLKSTQQDFSAVIESSIKKVVTVTTDVSAGTGFSVGNGYIATNHHVIEGSSQVQIQTYDNEVYTAQLIGSDATMDIALLKISKELNGFVLADSNEVDVGEKVIAIGNPLGLQFTVTEGIVSAVHREGPNGRQAYIQTDVTLNPGNSGGPLINREGQIIGMNNFKVGGAEALGFAVESNAVKDTLNEIANEQIVA